MQTGEFHISSTQKGYPNKKHWQFCVGSGHALLALRTDYTRQLKFTWWLQTLKMWYSFAVFLLLHPEEFWLETV